MWDVESSKEKKTVCGGLPWDGCPVPRRRETCSQDEEQDLAVCMFVQRRLRWKRLFRSHNPDKRVMAWFVVVPHPTATPGWASGRVCYPAGYGVTNIASSAWPGEYVGSLSRAQRRAGHQKHVPPATRMHAHASWNLPCSVNCAEDTSAWALHQAMQTIGNPWDNLGHANICTALLALPPAPAQEGCPGLSVYLPSL